MTRLPGVLFCANDSAAHKQIKMVSVVFRPHAPIVGVAAVSPKKKRPVDRQPRRQLRKMPSHDQDGEITAEDPARGEAEPKDRAVESFRLSQ
jgi:hypothetical protein